MSSELSNTLCSRTEDWEEVLVGQKWMEIRCRGAFYYFMLLRLGGSLDFVIHWYTDSNIRS